MGKLHRELVNIFQQVWGEKGPVLFHILTISLKS